MCVYITDAGTPDQLGAHGRARDRNDVAVPSRRHAPVSLESFDEQSHYHRSLHRSTLYRWLYVLLGASFIFYFFFSAVSFPSASLTLVPAYNEALRVVAAMTCADLRMEVTPELSGAGPLRALLRVVLFMNEPERLPHSVFELSEYRKNEI